MRRVAISALILLASFGCGRKAPPQPPVILVADRTTDLVVRQTGKRADLVWSYPSSTTAGTTIPAVEAVEIWRLSLRPGTEPPRYSDRLREAADQMLLAQGELLGVLETESLNSATRGPKLTFSDDLEAWYDSNADDFPLVLWYAVRTRCCGERMSAVSEIGRLLPTLPPGSPRKLQARASSGGIILSWTPIEARPVLIERATAQDDWKRMTETPVSGATWLDSSATQGQYWRYRLRSVETLEDRSTVIGDPGAELGLDHPDLYPPDIPADLVCLPEGDAVRLRWRSATGASHYQISRKRDGLDNWVHLDLEASRTIFVDGEPPQGRLTYAVKALDESGNESEAARCQTVIREP